MSIEAALLRLCSGTLMPWHFEGETFELARLWSISTEGVKRELQSNLRSLVASDVHT